MALELRMVSTFFNDEKNSLKRLFCDTLKSFSIFLEQAHQLHLEVPLPLQHRHTAQVSEAVGAAARRLLRCYTPNTTTEVRTDISV